MNPSTNSDYLQTIDKFFGRLGLWMYGHKLIVALLTFGLLAAGVYFAATTRTDNSFDSFFDADDPTFTSYLAYQDEFGSDEVAYILYSVPESEHGAFDLPAMEKIAELTETLEAEVPFVKDVTSLSNVEFITATDDLLEIHELALDMPENQTSMLTRGEAMMLKPGYRGSIVDDAAAHGAIIMEMTVTSSDSLDKLRLDPDGGDGLDNLYPQAAGNKIIQILARPEYQGIEFYLSGDVPMNSAYNTVINDEIGVQIALTLSLVSIIALICFRMQLLGLVGPISVVIFSFILTIGFMGLAGFKIGILFLIAPTLLTAIGVAQSVHLITEFNLMRSKGLPRKDAIQLALEHVAMPCLLAAFTTAVGFMVMASSQMRALSELAIYLGAGVLLAFVASISVMVVLMSLGKEKAVIKEGPSEKKSGLFHNLLKSVVQTNLKHRMAVLALFFSILGTSFVGLSKLHVGFNFLEEFKPHVTFHKHTDYIQDVMGGMLNVVFIYDSGETDGARDVELLSHLESLQAHAEQYSLVKKTYSVVDILKDVNQSFNGDDPEYYRLPNDRDLISQYLLMYEISGGEDLSDFVSGDYQSTTLELRVDITDSSYIATLVDGLQAYLEANPAPTGVEIKFTGIGLLWIKMAEYIADSQMVGYGLAFTIIAIILIIAFRSVIVGLLAMIPNLFPVIVVLGLLGWFDIHLDYFRLLLATVAIGIAVDDTVHTVTRIRKEFFKTGNYETAISNALMSVGRALVVTTIILTLSFLVFLKSDMSVLTNFGVLLSVTMISALIADLYLLPSLVLVLKPFGPEFNASESDTDTASTAATSSPT